ncbi:tetratricopeptide repeat protein 39A isoform X1 [Octopus sinensis]|uniref:Tetratricopeptide repeat protein 39A isoform X1 n=1 Tax=Octopus sinensis TaxID=2607531 RepID=A0A6P7SL53_9MOLL|nr:tetratricopeptide repeat protein 39A isoform X1 [Octopus sinensis]
MSAQQVCLGETDADKTVESVIKHKADSKEIAPITPENVTLDSSIEEANVVLNLFLNNKFTEARQRLEPCAGYSIYHSLSYSVILYIQAMMTFDMADIENAIAAIKKTIIVSNNSRRKGNLIGSLARSTKDQYDSYTEAECHAELCYAEALLIRAMLTFVQDENLISFVKGGLKIRECYKTYKDCSKMLQQRNCPNDKHKAHFESGVCMGIGSFNLMISMLPGKILRLLEFVGFTGYKNEGLIELDKGSQLHTSLRGPLCSIILVAYHTVVSFVLGLGDGDVDYAAKVLKPCIKTYPKGALFLFFSGRVEVVRANIDEAVMKFEESIESQSEWRQFHHLCYWELMWCHCYKNDWLIAMKYAERLCRESRWSKATYTYQKASFLMMCENPTEDTTTHLEYLLGEVPKLKQRIAGKSLPIEKFAVCKANRFFSQGGKLTLPGLELLYVWNGFTIIGKKEHLLTPFMDMVESTINTITSNPDAYPNYHDDYSLALLLKGVCLKYRGQYFQAEQCFLEVIGYEKKIKIDTYLVPYAHLELSLMYLILQKPADVQNYIQKAKRNYKGYMLESRLHFRIHAVKIQLHAKFQNNCENDSAPQTPGANEKEKLLGSNEQSPT